MRASQYIVPPATGGRSFEPYRTGPEVFPLTHTISLDLTVRPEASPIAAQANNTQVLDMQKQQTRLVNPGDRRANE